MNLVYRTSGSQPRNLGVTELKTSTAVTVRAALTVACIAFVVPARADMVATSIASQAAVGSYLPPTSANPSGLWTNYNSTLDTSSASGTLHTPASAGTQYGTAASSISYNFQSSAHSLTLDYTASAMLPFVPNPGDPTTESTGSWGSNSGESVSDYFVGSGCFCGGASTPAINQTTFTLTSASDISVAADFALTGNTAGYNYYSLLEQNPVSGLFESVAGFGSDFSRTGHPNSASTAVGVGKYELIVGSAFQGSDGTGNASVSVSIVSPVPLPAAVWLMLSGLGGLGTMSRARKARGALTQYST
jgi:hypothetical protein